MSDKKHTIVWVTMLCIIGICTQCSLAKDKAGIMDVFFLTGYGIPVGGYNEVALDDQTISSSGQTEQVKNHYLNYGHGWQFRLGGDYFLADELSMQFAFNWTAGVPSIKVKFDDEQFDIHYTETYNRNLFGFNVLIVPHFEMFELLDMYSGIGIGLSFGSLKFENSDKENFEYEGYFKTKPGLTFSAMLGSDFELSDKLTLFGEVSCDMASLKLKSRRNTNSATQIDYVKDSNSNPAPVKLPVSNVGIRVGVRWELFNLGGASEVF